MIDAPTSIPDTAPAVADSAEAPRPLPEWSRDRASWRRAAVKAAGIAATILALAFMVAIAITALVDATSGSAGTRDLLGASPSAVGTADLLRLWAAVFFTAHLVPYTGSSGLASVTVFGVGPLLLTGFVLVLSYRAGRALGLSAPVEASMGTRAGRAALLAVPYGLICLMVYIIARVLPGGETADGVVSPSLLALITPWVLVGAAGAFGGMTARPGLPAGGAVRAAVAGVYAVFVGLALLAVLGLVVSAIKLAIAPPSVGTASAPAILGGLVLAAVYAVNAVGLGWGDALGLTLFDQGAYALLVVAPLVGAVAGGLVVHRRARLLDRSAYVAAFAITSALLCLVATPIATGGALGVGTTVTSGGSPLIVLPVASLVAVAAVWGAAYVPLVNVPLWSRFAAAVTRVPGHTAVSGAAAGVSAAAGRAAAAAPLSSGSVVDEPPASRPLRPTVPRWAWMSLVAIVVVGTGLATTNAVLSSRYSPESTIEAFLAARAAHDNATLLAVTVFHAAGDGTMLTDRAALDRMDRLPQNRRSDIRDVRVVSLNTDGQRATADVSYTTGGVQKHLSLTLVQRSGTKHLGLYPTWQVQIEAPALTIVSSALHGAVFVDGSPIDVGGSGSSSVYVVPGYHEVHMAPGPVTLGDRQVIAAEGAEADPVRLQATLSPAGEKAARQALHDLYARCAAATVLEPDRCPNAVYNGGGQVANVQWTLTTDPASTATLELDPDDGLVTARGKWEMAVGYEYRYDCPGCDSPPPVEHENDHDGGSFVHRLMWNGSSFDVGPTAPDF